MSLENLKSLRFGYLPYTPEGAGPGDRRRFPAAAHKLGLNWELFQEGKDYDVLYVCSSADLTRFRRIPPAKTKIVFDMVDSYLAVSRWDVTGLIRGPGKWLLRAHRYPEFNFQRAVAQMARRADLVVCATPEQRSTFEAFNSNVHAILDFHEELGSRPQPGPVGKKLDILWEGVGLSTRHFALVAPVLARLADEFPLRLHLVTDLTYRPFNFPFPVVDTKKSLAKKLGKVEFYLAEWNPAVLRGLANQAQLGIIPIDLNNSLARAKSENKLLILWRLGLPVVVSATPAYLRTMKAYGGPQWVGETAQDWESHLRHALSCSEARQQAVTQAQAYLEREADASTLLQKWVAALQTLTA